MNNWRICNHPLRVIPHPTPLSTARVKGTEAETNARRIEVAVKQILSGLPVKTNASVANPEALEWFKAWAASN